MAEYSLSMTVRKSDQASPSHNDRSCYENKKKDEYGNEYYECNYPEHIKADRVSKNIILKNEKLPDAYDFVFGDAVKEYNATQPRKDRKIKSYCKKICESKKEKPLYEIIVEVGDMFNSEELKEQILPQIYKEFYQLFEKKYGYNFYSPGGFIHMDEANPHLHIDYIPVAHTPKGNAKSASGVGGLRVRNSATEALREHGYNIDKAFISKEEKRLMEQGKVPKKDGFDLWYADLRNDLEEVCKKYGIERVDMHKAGEENKDAEKLELERQIKELTATIESKQTFVNNLETHIESLTDDINTKNETIREKNEEIEKKGLELNAKNNSIRDKEKEIQEKDSEISVKNTIIRDKQSKADTIISDANTKADEILSTAKSTLADLNDNQIPTAQQKLQTAQNETNEEMEKIKVLQHQYKAIEKQKDRVEKTPFFKNLFLMFRSFVFNFIVRIIPDKEENWDILNFLYDLQYNSTTFTDFSERLENFLHPEIQSKPEDVAESAVQKYRDDEDEREM